MINRLQFKVWNEVIFSLSHKKTFLFVTPAVSFAGTFSMLLRSLHKCLQIHCENKTPVRISSALCAPRWFNLLCSLQRFPRLIRVGTIRFIHNEQTFVFSLPACCRWGRFCWREASARSHRWWRRFILELSWCSASDVDLVAAGFFVGDLRFVLFWFLLASACLCWG